MSKMELEMFKKEEKNDLDNQISVQQPFINKKKEQDELAFDEIRQQIIGLVRILRTLEDRYNNLMKKSQLTEQNMINEHKRLNNELKLVDSDLIDAKKELNELDYKFGLIIKELELCAKKQDVDLAKRYIELWQPMSFIRKKDAEKLVDDLIKEKTRKIEKVL